MQGLIRYLEYKRQHPEARLLPFSTDVTRHVSSSIPNLPTGGYFAVIFALQTCVAVSVYGFHWRPGHAIPHHYFNSEEPVRGRMMIHDYSREAENIRALAAAGLVTFRQPCVAGCEAESGVACGTACAPGSACACGPGMPTPVALPGYCHARLNFTCFVKCPGGASQCVGGPRHSRCPRAVGIDGSGLPCVTESEMSLRGERLAPAPAWTKKGWVDPSRAGALHGGGSWADELRSGGGRVEGSSGGGGKGGGGGGALRGSGARAGGSRGAGAAPAGGVGTASRRRNGRRRGS
jgi:uncharacterized membrane protein YgcG